MRKLLVPVVLTLLSAGCGMNQKEVKPEDGFTKIYNHPEETLSFYPEGVLELSGGGYMFISAVKDETSEIEYPYTHVVRTDPKGVVTWTASYDWLAPASNMISLGSSVGFVAMDAQLNAFAVLLDPATGETGALHDLDMTAPLYVYNDSQGQLVVLGFDFISSSSWVSRYNSQFGLERTSKYPAKTDLQLPIQRHLNKSGHQYPFFIGEYSNEDGIGYIISCFYEYTLLTAFADRSSLTLSGDVFSFQTVEAISSCIHKSGNGFGLTGYYEGNNYIVPLGKLDVNTSQDVRDLERIQLYELTYQAPVAATTLKAENADYTLFTTQTNDNAIVTYQYLMESDSLLRSHARHFDQRVEVAEIIPTSDGGTVTLASTYILGKYRRPVLVKEPAVRYEEEE